MTWGFDDDKPKFKEIAKIFGVELNQRFKVITRNGSLYKGTFWFTEKGFCCKSCLYTDDYAILYFLLTGRYRIVDVDYEAEGEV